MCIYTRFLGRMLIVQETVMKLTPSLSQAVEQYKEAEVVWCQEEPKNMVRNQSTRIASYFHGLILIAGLPAIMHALQCRELLLKGACMPRGLGAT